MSPLRNGSLFANALLVAIGAAAGAGMTYLLVPHGGSSDTVSGPRGLEKDESSVRAPALGELAGGSSHSFNALTELMEFKDPEERSRALREAGAEAARRDPASALAMAEQFRSDQDKLDFMRGIYGVWGGNDPRAALDHANSNFTAGLLRSETIGIAMNKWGSRDPRGAWLWAEQHLSGPLKDQALTDLVIGWTRQAPTVAAKWLEGTRYYSQPLFAAIGSTWAEQDPLAAANWAAGLNNADARRTTQTVIAQTWAERTPMEAAKHFEPLLTGDNGVNLATVLADIWGTSDPAAAAAWISQLSNSAARLEAAATLATVWSASDINAAVAWSRTLTDPQIRRQVIAQIGTTWGAIEPDSALNWLNTLPAGDASGGVVGAYNSWAATDAVGLGEWIAANPPSAAMDTARLSLADVISDQDMAGAMDLAFGISTLAGRDDAISRYYHHWRKVDEASAQDWLAQTLPSLPASTQTRLRQEQDRPIVVR